MAEQSLNWRPKSSHDLQYSTLALTGLDGQLERPNLINQASPVSLLSNFCKNLN